MARLPFDPQKHCAARQAPGPRAAGGASTGASRQSSSSSSSSSANRPLTVSQLAEQIKTALGDHFPAKVRVVGEISNLSQRQHCFFSLKDDRATLSCVCFASNMRRISTPVEDGMQVVATGRMDYYPAQGRTQLYVEDMEPIGQGRWS